MNRFRRILAAVLALLMAGACAHSIRLAWAGSNTVTVKGFAVRSHGGEQVQVKYPGTGWINNDTAYGWYQINNVPNNVIVVARMEDADGHHSKVVAGATSDKSQGGDARNGVMTMPTLRW